MSPPNLANQLPDSDLPPSPPSKNPHPSQSSPPHRMSPIAALRSLSPNPSGASNEPPVQSQTSKSATDSVDEEAKEPVARLRTGRKSSGGPSTSTKRKRAVGAAATRSKRRKADSPHSVSGEVTSEREEPASDDEECQEEEEEEDDGAVVVAADAPAYIWKVVHMCDLLQVREEMKDLLQSWVNLEATAEYEGNGILTAFSRPPQIAEWIQHGRRPNFKPKISDVEQYGDKFRTWFQKCCPAWRTPKQGTVMAREPGQDWSEMRITGQNGLASIIAATAFWRNALEGVPRRTARDKQARERLEDQYQAAFEEVSYCLSQMNGE
ncbi:hypothetical protein V5O48_007124 [Marasmius crinis-equi]|uniref:Uncharacterized protein n=1 Tax=Marasmius crinis-equi TaxID=585013 RepID=A0ABR3FHN4_9AGAR